MSELPDLRAGYTNPIRADRQKDNAMKYIVERRAMCSREGARSTRRHHRTKKALHKGVLRSVVTPRGIEPLLQP